MEFCIRPSFFYQVGLTLCLFLALTQGVNGAAVIQKWDISEVKVQNSTFPVFEFEMDQKPETKSHFSAESGNLNFFFQETSLKFATTMRQIQKGGVNIASISSDGSNGVRITFRLTEKLFAQTHWNEAQKTFRVVLTPAEQIDISRWFAPGRTLDPTPQKAVQEVPAKDPKKELPPMFLPDGGTGTNSVPEGPIPSAPRMDPLEVPSSLSVENMKVSRILPLIVPNRYQVDLPADLDQLITLDVKNIPLNQVLKHIARKMGAMVSLSPSRIKFARPGDLFPIPDDRVLERVEFQDVVLLEILRAIADLCDVNILIDPSADVIARNRVNFFVKELDYRSTFELLLSVNKLKSKVLSGSTLMILSEEAYKDNILPAFKIFKLQYSEATRTEERVKGVFSERDPNLKITVDKERNSLEINCDPALLPTISEFIHSVESSEVREITERIPIWNAVLKEGPDGDELTNLVDVIKKSLEEYKLPAKIIPDPRNKSLILTGTPYQIEMTRALVKALDVRRKQVLIQVRVMEISLNDANRLGLAPTTDSASIQSIHAIPQLKDIPISATLDFLIKKNRAKTRANPSIRALDGEKASIEIGQEIPVIVREKQTFNNPNQNAVVSGGGTAQAALPVDFVTETSRIEKIAIKLDLTPNIHQDGQISLKININQDDLIQVIDFAGVQKGFRRVDTRITVRNNETIIIGGLISQKTSHEERPWPILSQIPLLKQLVKNKNQLDVQNELLIFLTPTLVNLEEHDSPGTVRAKTGLPPHSATY